MILKATHSKMVFLRIRMNFWGSKLHKTLLKLPLNFKSQPPVKYAFLQISQNSQENTCTGDIF